MSNYYLAFDFGTKYIGIAVGQDVTHTARPLTTIKLVAQAIDWPSIKKIVQQWSPKALIVGIPQEMHGKNQWITESAKKFAEQLAIETQRKVHTIDERLSTIEAKEVLFDRGGHRALEKEAIDAMAAAVILQTWLQSTVTDNPQPLD